MDWTHHYTIQIGGQRNFIQTKHSIGKGDIISFNNQSFMVIERRFEMIKRGALEVQRVVLEVQRI